MKRITVALLTLLIVSCNKEPKKGFYLEGKTKGITNGSYVYIDYENKILDSVKVENNTFEFNTKLPITPMHLWLHDKDFSNYRAFWAVNNKMTFDATKTDFRNATITGSELELLSQALYKGTDSLSREQMLEKETKFVKEHPNSMLSANILSVYATTFGREKTKELFDPFSEENKQNQYGQKIHKYLELNKNPKVGEQFVDFEMMNKNGEVVKLSANKGKVTLLEFWASWCQPCREENPNLVKTYSEFHPKGFEIFAVSLDMNKDIWLESIDTDGLVWEHVSDLKGQENEASLIYGINSVPDNFLIDENGKIIGRNLRGDALKEKLSEVLQ